MTKVIVVNGPNLGRLGVRQPDVYGRQDLDTLRKLCAEWGKDLGLEVEVRQTDDEAEMVHWMHQAADEKTPVVMNPAAFTHYSYALADAAHSSSMSCVSCCATRRFPTNRTRILVRARLMDPKYAVYSTICWPRQDETGCLRATTPATSWKSFIHRRTWRPTVTSPSSTTST